MSTDSIDSASRIEGGSPTVFVSDMARALAFYTETLGFRIAYQAELYYAEVDAGNGFLIGLHPASPSAASPGTRGSIQVGFNVKGPIEPLVEILRSRGVKFIGPIVDDDPVKIAHFHDPDGNELYLCELKQHG